MDDEISTRHKLLGAIGSAVLVLAVGSLIFHWVEGWAYFDAFYFSFITLTTVGYGDFTPATALGKGISIVYILFGIGVFLSLVNTLAQHQTETAKRKYRKKRKKQAAKAKK